MEGREGRTEREGQGNGAPEEEKSERTMKRRMPTHLIIFELLRLNQLVDNFILNRTQLRTSSAQQFRPSSHLVHSLSPSPVFNLDLSSTIAHL